MVIGATAKTWYLRTAEEQVVVAEEQNKER